MKTDTLLVEVRTEELPPPAVRVLAEKFPQELLNRLREGGLTDSKTPRNGMFATPRRFAALIDGVQERAKDRKVTRRGPQVKDGLDSAGKPSPALQGFMRAVGISDVTELAREKEKEREYFVWRGEKPGAALADVLPQMVTDSMCAIPDFPSMTWGAHDYAFVRPVRGLVMMLGNKVIPGEVMGAKSGRITRGHPALAAKSVTINNAANYESALKDNNVIVDYNERNRELARILQDAKDEANARFFGAVTKRGKIPSNKLKKEVVAMCEKPQGYICEVSKVFWKQPLDCVASFLVKHHRCFPLLNAEEVTNQLRISKFVFIADNTPEDPEEIIGGVSAVVHARLRDFAFYTQVDEKLTEKEAWEKLDNIVYHRKLGSQSARAKRIVAIAASVGKIMKLNKEEIDALKRAAEVCKLDLPTMAVGEYPELAGKMAAYCFCREERRVANIVARHGDNDFEPYDYELHEEARWQLLAIALYLADKLEKIIGMFLIGEKPAGRKDPHGLRRAAGQIADVLALLDNISQNSAKHVAELSLIALLTNALHSFGGEFDTKKIDISGEVYDFIVNRISLPGIDAEVKNAVNAYRPLRIAEIPRRCKALQEFLRHDKAQSLIAANKRVNNILRKVRENKDMPKVLSLSRDSLEDAERDLRDCLAELQEETQQRLEKDDYQGMLSVLATKAADPVREFFDNVMVNTDDETLRHHRLALLNDLQKQLNKVADLAHLSVRK